MEENCASTSNKMDDTFKSNNVDFSTEEIEGKALLDPVFVKTEFVNPDCKIEPEDFEYSQDDLHHSVDIKEEECDTTQQLDQSISKSGSCVFFWSADATKSLIDLYKKYRSKVGCMKMKNFKAMWDVIGKELSNLLSTEISSKNCENRWKVLDRNYKKWVYNKNSTGRRRKCFEFSEEMDDIYGKKRSVKPVLTLGNEIHVPAEIKNVPEMNTEKTEVSPSSSSINIVESPNRSELLRKKNLIKRKSILKQMREDRLEYQEKRLAFLKEAHQETMTLLREKNEIKRERNEILKQKHCSCELK